MNIWVEVALAVALAIAIGWLWMFLRELLPAIKKITLKDGGKGVDNIGVAVACFCHDGAGKYMVSLRSKNTRDEQGRWETGGGSIEFGEHIEEALKREMKEEFSVELFDIEFLGYRDVHRTKPDGTPTHWVLLDFRARVNPDQVKIGEPDMVDEVRWVSKDAVPSPMHSQFVVFLNKYKDKL